jgi:hypothetical protein
MKTTHVFLLLFAVTVLSACTALQQLAALSKCQFKIDSIKNTSLAGVKIQGLRNFQSLSVTDAARATTSLLSGKLPLDFTMNVAVKNPNTMTAAMTRMDWEALIDDSKLLGGTVTDRVEVPGNGGTATLPLNISVNLKQIFNTLTRDQLLSLPFGLADAQDKPTRVALRMKPTIEVATRPLTYPGWFTVKRDFTAGS